MLTFADPVTWTSPVMELVLSIVVSLLIVVVVARAGAAAPQASRRKKRPRASFRLPRRGAAPVLSTCTRAIMLGSFLCHRHSGARVPRWALLLRPPGQLRIDGTPSGL